MSPMALSLPLSTLSASEPDRVSTSLNAQSSLPASYHPFPRPQPLPAFRRVDIHAVKQELHDVLGEDGLPYWKALNGYLLGQVGRDELEIMVKGWLKGTKLTLHNRLILSLLHNASVPPASHALQLPLSHHKRKRLDLDDPDFDTDDAFIEAKARVQQWVMGISGRERARMRRATSGMTQDGDVDGEDKGDWAGGQTKWSNFTPNTTMPPLALSSRQLPSSHQLSLRLSQLAKAHELSLAPDADDDIGEFMAVGVDAHLGDLLHGIVHLTGRDRPGMDTIRVLRRSKHDASDRKSVDEEDAFLTINQEGELPKPNIETFQSLFNIAPGLHPQASPALYKLATTFTLAEAEYNSPLKSERSPSSAPLEIGARKAEAVSAKLLETGLLKIDKAIRQSDGAEGDGKKDRKHNLHWKYEDPALILRDILG